MKAFSQLNQIIEKYDPNVLQNAKELRRKVDVKLFFNFSFLEPLKRGSLLGSLKIASISTNSMESIFLEQILNSNFLATPGFSIFNYFMEAIFIISYYNKKGLLRQRDEFLDVRAGNSVIENYRV